MTIEMTRSERREKREARRKEREAEQEQRRRHTIKQVEVCDAYHAKPQYQGDYTEDGERPILNPPHAWFILVTRQDGTRWFLREDAPFFTFWAIGTMERDLASGFKGDDGEQQPLFQAGPSHVMKLEGLIAKARMEERAEAVRSTRVLDPDTAEWGRWPYSEYGSDSWAAEMQGVEMRERQDPRNW
jgi:hypothetical protein